MFPKLIVILGPTASGKTELAIKLARKFNGEIVCADSRQIYQEMTIGTAKTPRSDPGVTAHLFDIIRPNQSFNVAQYQKLAIKTIKDIQKRGKLPFLVGGTAFYINSVVEGWQFPKSKANPALRKKLENESPAELFKILQKIDKARAENIDKGNPHRLIRAIEMAKQFGEVPTITKKPQFDCLVLGTKINQKELEKRIEKRTNEMLKQGLEKEAKALVKKYGWTPILRNTIGYAEWQNLLNLTKSSSAELDLVKFTTLISLHTMQFAKRQMTWFKKNEQILWVKNYQESARKISTFLDD
ncbi:MAG: tRNA (adenosine(37)-N6)-dimethylallyltransferase MiaA [Candidatus Gribaldobacteria bacterium]|nr:tRNA (adenosine(37)-N6)-dimethylallyltransferase MiaA [Candidatus Gribaldobacteria bacterium]